MTIVLDASAAMYAAQGLSAGMEFLPVLEQAERVLVPDLFAAEVTNACWKFVQAEILKTPEAQDLLYRCLQFPTEFAPTASLAGAALELSIAFRVPSYDMLYVALAKERGARLVTADAKLAKLAARTGVAS